VIRQVSVQATGDAPAQQKHVLNAGCGFYSPAKLHGAFRDPAWKEIRLDIDPQVRPDIVGSITDLGKIPAGSFDAVWCSHNLEHLHTHDVNKALREFVRVLKPDGFALINSPDLEIIARFILEGRLEEIAYESQAGPITPLDMLFGHSASIAQGQIYMAHHTGFTSETLGRRLAHCGFSEVFAKKGAGFDIWALALMPNAARDELLAKLASSGVDFTPGEIE
jgi:SAM-dependent methyltransferase